MANEQARVYETQPHCRSRQAAAKAAEAEARREAAAKAAKEVG